MTSRRLPTLLSCLVAGLLLLQSPAVTAAADGPQVVQAWARATPGLAKNGVAYMTIANPGGEAERLLAASSAVAEHSGLHSHIMQDGTMMMRPVEAIEVPAGGQVVLKPGGLHVMLMGLTTPLREGDRFALDLTFERAGALSVEVEVLGIGAMGPDSGPDAGHSHDMPQQMEHQMEHQMQQDGSGQ